MKLWNVGFLGCGAIARTHAQAFQTMPNVRIGAWWNRSPERAKALHAEFGGAYWTEDWNRIVSDPAIDAIYLNTMHNDRLRFLEAAAAAGKPVFCEKPLAHSPETLRAMHALVSRTGMHLHAGYKIRYHSIMARACEALPAPEILHAQVFDETWPEGALNDPEVGGGNILCQGVYAAESLRILAGGDPVSVSAAIRCSRHSSHTPDTLAATFVFGNGAIATLAVADAGLAPEPISKFCITAAGGNASIAILNRYQSLAVRTAAGMAEHTFPEDGFRRQSERFFARLEAGQSPEIPFLDGAMPSIMMWRAMEAAASGRTLAIDANGFLSQS